MSQNPRPVISDSLMRSFGRIKTRPLSDDKVELINNFLPEIAVNIDKKINPEKTFPDKKSIQLEIGFGCGERLAEFAHLNPDIGFFASEPFTNGLASLLVLIKKYELKNIRILHGDARVLLEQLPDEALDHVYILFPDPWPKLKHHKKRIISTQTLELLGKKIKKGGFLYVVTDHVEYSKWIARHLNEKSDIFTENPENRDKTPDGWIKTKYQIKAEKQGRKPVFFICKKV